MPFPGLPIYIELEDIAECNNDVQLLAGHCALYTVTYATPEEARGARTETAKSKWMLLLTRLQAVQSSQGEVRRRASDLCQHNQANSTNLRKYSCQKTGEACDYSVRLNWEGRRTKRSQSFGTPSQISQSLQDTTQIQPPSFTHTFSINPSPNAQIQPKPIPRPRRIQTAPGTFDPGRRNQAESLDRNDVPGEGFFYSTPPQETQVPIPSPTIPKHVVDTFSAASNLRRSNSAAASSSQRPHKRSRSFAESSESEVYHSRSNLLASPASFSGASPPICRIRSNTGSTSRGSPLTPASSAFRADDELRTPLPALPSPASPGNSRLSVNYLLTGSPGVAHRPKSVTQLEFGSPLPDLASVTEAPGDATFYGYDLGIWDSDINQNNDTDAISQMPSRATDAFFDGYGNSSRPRRYEGGSLHDTLSRLAGGYYDRPVPIWIPRNLEPLPAKYASRKSHAPLVLFLVPYDDPTSNPFRVILPQMAVRNDHLLSLLLAYSGTWIKLATSSSYSNSTQASHRARLLRQREPQMRIAFWVQDIFPALRLALSDREQIISNTSLATAIMLASLEIISPTAFGYEIPWQTHLNLARDLMRKRLTDLKRTAYGLEEDQVCSFLWSWFAYLDVLGSLSGGVPDGDPSRPWVLEYTMLNSVDDQYEIDCIMGFTTKCVQLLAQIAELSRHCDTQRIGAAAAAAGRGPASQQDWTPTMDCIRRAQELERELRDSMTQPSHPCRHVHDVEARDRQEMVLMNEAFHWAGLVHLHRRVFGKSSGHADVQGPVQRILSCMGCIRSGGTAETGFLFPMFTAGCNTLGGDQWTMILERFKSVESNGMTQVQKARRLMERVWETGQPWEPLLCTEFIG
ncbi:cyclophilin type peptidyl-prolyl cis-trans isomerase/CLD [Colletotrichum sojae]|uniref:Cyclophilin type peptidyl-prolyl cis-trans isomerase/CLD n=1 Tax=Colletotrichum sojae TaxID=2175907 RepID=A0A8H6JJW1_9PEZI|nr:cyclophilin type peptidyl-prolyl cis-trans isomerase/CLD [Colletotrichum sojae]